MKGKFDFAGFYESIQKEALRYASGYVFDEEDVRDIVGDSWLRLLEMGETLDSERKVNCLLFAIIKSIVRKIDKFFTFASVMII